MKLKFFTLIIFLISIFIQNIYSQQNTNGWYWVNSRPQSNTLNWVQVVDATHFYAVGHNGTFMKSTDGGDSWMINTEAGVSDELFGAGNSLNINAGWFFNANTGIVAGLSNFGDGGIIKKTTNGGETFTNINLGLSSGLTIVNDMYFINSTTGYICGNENVKALKTTDAGLTWNQLPNIPSTQNSFKTVFAADLNHIYIGESQSGKILRTSNGGVSWTEDSISSGPNIEITDILFINSSTGFVSGNPCFFAYTTNGGVNWTERSFPDTQQGIYDLDAVGSTVYALGPFDKYYYTSDLGLSWNPVNFSDQSNIHQPDNFYVFSFDIKDNNVIVVGANGKVNVSNDNGTSWRNKNYSVGNTNIAFTSVYAQPGTNNVWAGGQAGIILASNNSGTNWYKYQTSALYSFNDIEMVNSATGYAVGGSIFAGVGYCYKTTNGGVSWSALNIPVTNTPYLGLNFINENTGWIFGGYAISSVPGLIYKTTNGGATWSSQAVTPADNSNILKGDMADANTGYITGGNKLWKTTNGGAVWNRINNVPEDVSWTNVKTFSPSKVYLGGKRSIMKSTDGGNTWQTVYIPNSQELIFNMDWFDENNGTVVGVFGYTAKTSDGGLTWQERNTGSSTLSDVSMPSANIVFTSCDRNVYGAIFRLNDFNNSITLNLKIGIQGFWNGTTQVGDTVRCHLRNSVSPFNEVEVVKAVMNTSGNATFNFTTAPAGSYYMEITHRNSLETWSASPIALSLGGSYNYDFTTSATQAYGNNMILTNSRYCNYSGDVTQEGSIDLNDVVNVNNAASGFTSGYVAQDITGDNFVDLSDLIMTFNNASNFVVKITP